MNSPFANLYLALQEYIAGLTSGGDKLIAYVDLDRYQLYVEGNPQLAYPSVLIDFEGWQFEQMGDSAQAGEGQVIFYLVFAPFSSTGSITPAPYMEKGLNYFDIEYQLHIALQNWSAGDNYGSLNRISATTEKIRADRRVRKIIYKLRLEDYSTLTVPAIADVPPVITPSFH